MNSSSIFPLLRIRGGRRLSLTMGLLTVVAWTLLCSNAWAFESKPFQPADLFDLRKVDDPQLAPDGSWVAYVVAVRDAKEDRTISNLWMSRWDGQRTLQLTRSSKGASSPRWSPDSRTLAFIEARGDDEAKAQVWLLDRDGGEARQLTKMPNGVEDYAWSPDGKQLALIAGDPDPDEPAVDASEAAKKLLPKPIVVDRYAFKDDDVGYVRGLRSHLYVFDLSTESATLLTPGDFDEASPVWSPDGTQIAFVSRRQGDPDRNENTDIYVIAATAGAQARALTSFIGADSAPAWSPDGKQIAFLRGGPVKFREYDPAKIAVMPAAGGDARILAADLDRDVSDLQWSADGKALRFLLEDDRSLQLAQFTVKDDKLTRLSAEKSVTSAYTQAGSKLALLFSTPLQPPEIIALERDQTRPLSAQNAALIARLRLSPMEGYQATAADGNVVHGLLLKPLDYQEGKRYPTAVLIHGGPVSQDSFEFDYIAQMYAGAGYLVVEPNYRGSSGRGREYSRSIWGAWGHKEVVDVLASVDHVVAAGLADPDRLGSVGWSYGGMLTNYSIASDTRFKAAISGAGISNMLAGYGTDQYTRQYELEFGKPWENKEKYLAASYPFFHADRITTPTLFLCGEKDFNVPLINSEQMYQALKSLGVTTQLVIYPDQHHGLNKPSHEVDRLQRYLGWFATHL